MERRSFFRALAGASTGAAVIKAAAPSASFTDLSDPKNRYQRADIPGAPDHLGSSDLLDLRTICTRASAVIGRRILENLRETVVTCVNPGIDCRYGDTIRIEGVTDDPDVLISRHFESTVRVTSLAVLEQNLANPGPSMFQAADRISNALMQIAQAGAYLYGKKYCSVVCGRLPEIPNSLGAVSGQARNPLIGIRSVLHYSHADMSLCLSADMLFGYRFYKEQKWIFAFKDRLKLSPGDGLKYAPEKV